MILSYFRENVVIKGYSYIEFNFKVDGMRYKVFFIIYNL